MIIERELEIGTKNRLKETVKLKIELTEAEISEAYQERELYYRIEDAKATTRALYPELTELFSITEEDYKFMAKEFLNKYDCNVAENDTWISIIESFINKNMSKGEDNND